MKIKKPILLALLPLAMGACAKSGAATEQVSAPPKPSLHFSADSAYAYVAAQTAFGPRVPGSQAAEQCGDWIVGKLQEFGAQNVVEQRGEVTAYTGKRLPIRNISAQFNADLPERILLLSHWDSRPWADQDPDPANRDKPIDGANDGASGVAVILEVARNLAANNPKMGLDVLFVDAEDYGCRADDKSKVEDSDDSWCLGTKYWVASPTLPLQSVSYAILLDMVGGKDAVFEREFHSQYACSSTVDKVWKAARKAGVSSRFPDTLGGAVVDDHIYLIQAGVPAIDIIECNNPETGSFNPTWHTQADNISNIDPATLQAVGLAVTQALIQ